jgi:hypothetical protein
MKVRIYFCKEADASLLLTRGRLSRQALDTIYELVWESEFKNLITTGKLWLKLNGATAPFGIALKEKRSHVTITPGDIIEIGREFYMVMEVGIKKIALS